MLLVNTEMASSLQSLNNALDYDHTSSMGYSTHGESHMLKVVDVSPLQLAIVQLLVVVLLEYVQYLHMATQPL